MLPERNWWGAQVLAEDITPALNRLRAEKLDASLHNERLVQLDEQKRRLAESSWAQDKR